jgi:transcriptional regulator with XRE-family HTH domain
LSQKTGGFGLNRIRDRSSEEDLGKAVRALRKERKLTLADLGGRSGLSVSTLSKVETGKMQLSYDKLQRISAGLDVDLATLFGGKVARAQPDDPRTLVGRRAVDLNGEGYLVETPNYLHRYCASSLLNKRFVPVIAEPKARTLEEFGPLVRHGGEEFALVMEGAVEVRTEIYAPLVLRPGDSMYIDSQMGHAYLKAAKGRCRLLVVCAGPETAATQDGTQQLLPTEEEAVA